MGCRFLLQGIFPTQGSVSSASCIAGKFFIAELLGKPDKEYMSVCVLAAQSCATLCSPTDCSLAGSFVHGILQARTLEWIAIPFSRR